MNFIWKVELSDSNSQSTTREIFSILGIPNFHSIYPIKDNASARDWYLSVSKACYAYRNTHFGSYLLGHIDGNSIILKDVLPRFSRYEQKKFLIFVLQYNTINPINSEILDSAQLELSRFLKHKFGNIIIDDFSVKIKIEKYIESIKIQNPVPVLNNEELNNLNTHNQWNILEAKNYTKLHTVQYVPSNEKDTFKRELKGIYLVDKDPISDGKNNARSLFYDIVHTEFMFFIRAKHLESELSQTFTSLSFLNSMVDFVEEEWVKIRTLFSVIPRFSVSKKSVASKLFFYILEVNAQMYALLTNLKFNMEHKKNYYEEAFERLHFTVEKDGNDAEIQYFRDINTLVYKGYESYNNKIKMLDSSVTQLSDNIQQLRADFDSNTNIVLQWLMFLLSIVLVVWGGITFIYDKGVDTFSNAINNPMYLVVAAVFGTLLIMLVFYIYLAKIWINKSSELLDREIKYMIKNWLNDSEKDDEDHKKLLIHKYKKIMGRKLDYDKKITYSLEFCSLIIPGVALKKIDEKEAEEMLTLIRRNF